MCRQEIIFHPRHTGAALPVGLILLASATLLALSGTRMSVLDLRLSLNDERQLQATQHAQSLVDAVLSNFPDADTRPVFAVRCLHTESGFELGEACRSASRLTLPPGFPLLLSDTSSNVMVAQSPDAATPPAGSGYSAVAFSAVQLRIIGGYDGTKQGLGRAQIEEGLSVLMPAATGSYRFSDASP